MIQIYEKCVLLRIIYNFSTNITFLKVHSFEAGVLYVEIIIILLLLLVIIL